MSNTYELTPKYDTRASFYGKAIVEDNGSPATLTTLYSYGTKAATLTATTDNGLQAKVYNVQSQTTLRHVREFLLQNGFKAENKAQIIADYSNL